MLFIKPILHIFYSLSIALSITLLTAPSEVIFPREHNSISRIASLRISNPSILQEPTIFFIAALTSGGVSGKNSMSMFIPYVVLRAGGESQAVQFLAIIPGGLAGESPAVQGLANICRDSRVVFKNLKPFRFQIFKHYPTFLLRGLAPAPPVSLATPRGQGSPLRFDTQPTG